MGNSCWSEKDSICVVERPIATAENLPVLNSETAENTRKQAEAAEAAEAARKQAEAAEELRKQAEAAEAARKKAEAAESARKAAAEAAEAARKEAYAKFILETIEVDAVSCSFFIRLKKENPSQKLGFRLVNAEGQLAMRNPTGKLLEEWHANNPSKQVRCGDEIIAVNGVRGDPDSLLRVLNSKVELDIKLRRQTTIKVEVPMREPLLRIDGNLAITSVEPGDVLDEYNSRSMPNMEIFEGDVLIGLDDMTSATHNLLDECRRKKDGEKLTLVFQRPAVAPARSKGAKGKIPKVASPNFDAPLSEKVTKAEAEAFCRGELPASFKEGMDKAEFFIDMCLIMVSTDDDGLLTQPETPKKRTVLVQIYIDDHVFGGTDKSCNGHRYDSIPFANGMIHAGISCYLIHYVHAFHDLFFKVMEKFDALLVRCNPGQIKDNGGDQNKFDDAMRDIKKKGIPVWPSPDVMTYMGAKDALTNIKDMSIGLSDTGTYYTEEELKDSFYKTMKFQRRVIKQNRGSSGEGIWIISLASGEYCKTFGDEIVKDDDKLILMEANDNHVEEHTVSEFIEWCVNGRTEKSGTWTSKGTGKYLEGGKEAGGQLVDQRFCGRILEGELRFNMVNDVCLGVIHKVPAPGGMSAVGGTGSVYTFYDNATLGSEPMGKFDFEAYVYKEKDASGNRHRVAPEEGPAKVEAGECVKETISVDLAALCNTFVQNDCPRLMDALKLPDEPIPLWWTADFINGATGECWTQPEEQKWVVGEFNCSCVGLSKCLPAYCKPDTPNVSYKDIPEQEKKDATIYGNIVGREAAKLLGV